MTGLRSLKLDVFYDAPGEELAKKVLIPALKKAMHYDRITAYFSIGSLISIGVGLNEFHRNGGRMRLLMGLHDVQHELVEAASRTDEIDEFEQLKQRVLNGVSTLKSELEKDRVRAAAWMMQQGMLTVRCVALNSSFGMTSGIFHNKRLIFSDAAGNVLSATGSVNETVQGLGSNFEELTLHKSWESPGYTHAHLSRFEEIWSGEDKRLIILPLTSDFADELLAAIGPTSDRQQLSISAHAGIGQLLSHSPYLTVMNSARLPLYPHQQQVVTSVTSRWPLRAILADEVGLGKTFEAAAIISFALRHAGVSRVVILAPPTLLRQWQEELYTAFNLDFWVFDNQRKAYFSAKGSRVSAPGGPFQDFCPELIIISSTLARGTRKTGHIFRKAPLLPDMVVLDEAHTARKQRTAAGVRDSLISKMMKELLERVPHALFLTATPLQMHASELYDLMELMGVPEDFGEDDFLRSLKLLSRGSDMPAALQDGLDVADFLRGFMEGYKIENRLPRQVRRLFTETSTRMMLARNAVSNWGTVYESLIAMHPASVLCVRNTRATLSHFGYNFPSRSFKSIDCETTPDLSRLLRTLNRYLNTHLGTVEEVLYPNRRTALGFVRSVYRQRAASSLHAISSSLQRRKARLRQLLDEPSSAEAVFDDEDLLDEANTLNEEAGAEKIDRPRLERACNIELADIEALLVMLDSLEPDLIQRDSKITTALKELNHFLNQDKCVLLFSRYTDTVAALVARFQQQTAGTAPFAVYTGDGATIHVGNNIHQVDKTGVTQALSDGIVQVVFCSDAASEGLNLQTASVLINVDVPWNPARLEQRIGRIARLGQQETEVAIVNLWYPGSVEAKIYRRLLSRKDLMDLALGSFPDIVGAKIKNAVLAGSSYKYEEEILSELNDKRGMLEMQTLSTMWAVFYQDRELSEAGSLEAEIWEVLRQIAISFKLESEVPWAFTAGQTDYSGLTLHPDWIAWLPALPDSIQGSEEAGLTLGVLAKADTPLCFALRKGNWLKVLKPSAIPDILRFLYLGKRLKLQQHVFLEFPLEAQMELSDSPNLPWWPRPESVTIPANHNGPLPALPAWASPDIPFSFWDFFCWEA